MKNVSFYPQSSNNTNNRVSVRFDQRGFGNPNSQTPTSPFFEITCAEFVFFFLASFLISFLFFQTRRCIGGLVCIEGLVPRRRLSCHHGKSRSVLFRVARSKLLHSLKFTISWQHR